ncbi:putative endonuclease [Salinibacter phage M8CC-19]|uniref:Putative endonuclease n=2 Tax=Kryptosalinivirus M8CC19 TaxID=2560720 RepID=A0A2I6UG61_9CAUD|nr:RecE-like recombination exonuclease [Salinibacter phage M8CC-19]AUO78965.1 putative endonuclease [Salinibacter phage M8CC-19]AUO79199.1 putative endonuclease [Salinibacter phage M31CC-1]
MSREFIDGLDRLDYLSRRQEYIGGADCAGVLGCSPFDTRYDIWQKKTCDVEQLSDIDNYHIRRGVFFEPIILRIMQGKEVYGQTLMDEAVAPDAVPGDHTRHDNYEYIGGTPDGIDDDFVYEIKAPQTSKVEEIKKGGLPDYWYLQAQHYSMIFGKPVRFYVFDYNHSDLIEFDLEPDEVLHEDMLIEYELFWEHVQTNTPPSEEGLLNPDFKAGKGGPEMDRLAYEYHKAHSTIKELKREKKKIRPKIMERMRNLDSIKTERFKVRISEMTRNGNTFPVMYVSEREIDQN